MKKRVVSISSIPEKEGKVKITQSKNVIYSIEEDVCIEVSPNVEVFILDITKNKKISVLGLEGSKIHYTIVESQNSQRVFQMEGELEINEIHLEENQEALWIDLIHEGASAQVNCLCIGSKVKNYFTQRITHSKKYTTSNISNVAVAMENSTIVFDTTGKIEKTMANSKCQQLSRGIVMDDDSTITAKPILLIDEYDCFANHGATIGKMSDEDLFYLMSRGLSKSEAFLLILQGIVQPFISNLEIESLKEKLQKEVSNLIEK